MINCPSCYCRKYKIFLLKKKKKYNISSYKQIRGIQNFYRCLKCDLIYEFPVPTIKDLNKRYAHNKRIEYNFNLKIKTYKNVFKNYSFLKNRISIKKNALDIGCGGGAALKVLEDLNYSVLGLEPSIYLSTKLKNKFKILNTNFESFSYKKKFHLILLFDVLEHLRNLNYVIKKIYKLMNNSCYLIINIPNESCIINKIFGKYSWWLISEHLYFFNKNSLNYLLTKNNLKIIKENYFFQYYKIGYLLKILSSLLFSHDNFFNFVPNFIKNLEIKYYAGQSTFLIKKKIT